MSKFGILVKSRSPVVLMEFHLDSLILPIPLYPRNPLRRQLLHLHPLQLLLVTARRRLLISPRNISRTALP